MFTDSHDSLIAIADTLGVHPCCGAELGDCRCDEEPETHPADCLCCLDEELDTALARVRTPPRWRAPRVNEAASFIDSGAL